MKQGENSTAPGVSEDIVAAEFEGGEGVLVDLRTKRYYQLNETAMLVWRSLEKGLPVANMVKEMTRVYEVSSEQASKSVERILLDLQSRKLVQAPPC